MSPIGSETSGIHKPCILSRTTNQSIPDSVFTAVSWNSEVLDEDNWHSNATNPERINPRFQTGWFNPAYTRPSSRR